MWRVLWRVLQLQHLVSDDVCVQAQELFSAEKVKGACGGHVSSMAERSASEAAYQRQAEQLMSDENCFRVVVVSTTAILVVSACDVTY